MIPKTNTSNGIQNGNHSTTTPISSIIPEATSIRLLLTEASWVNEWPTPSVTKSIMKVNINQINIFEIADRLNVELVVSSSCLIGSFKICCEVIGVDWH